MFKYLVVIALVTSLILIVATCGEKSTSEKLSDAAEAVKHDVADAVDDAGDSLHEAAEDTKEAARNATK